MTTKLVSGQWGMGWVWLRKLHHLRFVDRQRLMGDQSFTRQFANWIWPVWNRHYQTPPIKHCWIVATQPGFVPFIRLARYLWFIQIKHPSFSICCVCSFRLEPVLRQRISMKTQRCIGQLELDAGSWPKFCCLRIVLQESCCSYTIVLWCNSDVLSDSNLV